MATAKTKPKHILVSLCFLASFGTQKIMYATRTGKSMKNEKHAIEKHA